MFKLDATDLRSTSFLENYSQESGAVRFLRDFWLRDVVDFDDLQVNWFS